MTRRAILIVAALCFSACGDDGPTGPTGQEVVDVAGVWTYTSTLSNVSGGECVGAALATILGTTDSGTMSVNQAGATLSATTRSNSSGSSCTYQGTAGRSTIALSWLTCDAANLTGFRCANGAIRNVSLVTDSINATVTGNRATGTNGSSYNVTTTLGAGVGVMTITANFTATR